MDDLFNKSKKQEAVYMSSEGFLTDIRTVELFFRICRRFNIQALPDRVALMRELTRRKKARYIRDVQPLMIGKKVLKIGFKKEPK